MLKLGWSTNIIQTCFLAAYPTWMCLALDTENTEPLMSNNMSAAANSFLQQHLLSASSVSMSGVLVGSEIQAKMRVLEDLVKSREYPLADSGTQIIPNNVTHNGTSQVPFSYLPLISHAHKINQLTNMTTIVFDFDLQQVDQVVYCQSVATSNRPSTITISYEVAGSPVQHVMTLGGASSKTVQPINAVISRITMTVPLSSWAIGSLTIIGQGTHVPEEVRSIVLMPLTFSSVINPWTLDMPAISLLPTECVLNRNTTSPIISIAPVGLISCGGAA